MIQNTAVAIAPALIDQFHPAGNVA